MELLRWSRHFLKPLIKSNGRVMVVSSESYKIQAMFQPYMISKAALEAYCRVARQELALKGVKLTVIRPGAIRHPVAELDVSACRSRKIPGISNRNSGKAGKKSIKMVGRITSPEKVARKILKASIGFKAEKNLSTSIITRCLTLVSFLPAGITDRLIIRMFRIKE